MVSGGNKAPRAGMGRRQREPSHRMGLRIDGAEITFLELGHPKIVFGVGYHLIHGVVMARRQLARRMEFLPGIAGEIEPENVLGADTLGPNLAVDVVAHSDEI